MNLPEGKPSVVSIAVARLEEAHYVLVVTYSNGVTGELRVKRNTEERYDRETLNYLFTMVFGRHFVHSLPAAVKEELLIAIEKAIWEYESQSSQERL